MRRHPIRLRLGHPTAETPIIRQIRSPKCGIAFVLTDTRRLGRLAASDTQDIATAVPPCLSRQLELVQLPPQATGSPNLGYR